ncbi:hypothetical protein ACH5RR_035746 [Cinchona calisaya]|uniref:Glycerol-3-phosphate acyltransferase RAM2/GPAT1-8 HAD-like domain-containing protein n=1 Tax=Cinchona calisaya TaxID=153742 RepID=A0ABD2Y149_9GENT
MATITFPTVDKCASIGRERDTVVADLDGTLLRGRSSFPHFALIAFDVGGILRLLFLLLTAPIAGLLYYFPGGLVGKNKADALKKAFGDERPEIGLGDRHTDIPSIAVCKEGYNVPLKLDVKAVTNDKLPKPIVFHDGRLVQKPTPLSY